MYMYYVLIFTISTVNFELHFNVDHVIISPSTGSTATTAGERDYSLTCSSILFDPSHLPSDVPSPKQNFAIFLK